MNNRQRVIQQGQGQSHRFTSPQQLQRHQTQSSNLQASTAGTRGLPRHSPSGAWAKQRSTQPLQTSGRVIGKENSQTVYGHQSTHALQNQISHSSRGIEHSGRQVVRTAQDQGAQRYLSPNARLGSQPSGRTLQRSPNQLSHQTTTNVTGRATTGYYHDQGVPVTQGTGYTKERRATTGPVTTSSGHYTGRGHITERGGTRTETNYRASPVGQQGTRVAVGEGRTYQQHLSEYQRIEKSPEVTGTRGYGQTIQRSPQTGVQTRGYEQTIQRSPQAQTLGQSQPTLIRDASGQLKYQTLSSSGHHIRKGSYDVQSKPTTQETYASGYKTHREYASPQPKYQKPAAGYQTQTSTYQKQLPILLNNTLLLKPMNQNLLFKNNLKTHFPNF